MEKSSVELELKEKDVVFVGKVIAKDSINTSTEPGFYRYNAEYYFKVQTIYKGEIKTDTIKVTTGMGSRDCGFLFEIGKDYIVYGRNFINSSNGNKYLYTNACYRTKLYQKSEIKEIIRCLEPKRN